MNQKKIGIFLKELRKKKNITQEQLAEYLNVTNRSVSRWETGKNLPDLDILIQLSEYYGVELRELLDGERKANMQEIKDTVLKVASYSNSEKQRITQKFHYLFIIGICAMIIYLVLEINNLTEIKIYENIASYSLGVVFGILFLGNIYTSKHFNKIRQFKQKIINKSKKR